MNLLLKCIGQAFLKHGLKAALDLVPFGGTAYDIAVECAVFDLVPVSGIVPVPLILEDRIYERFRPAIPEGVKGWGATGNLDLGLIERLAKDTK
jgi:hypothetical protein